MAVYGDCVGDYIIFATVSERAPGLSRLYSVEHGEEI